MTLFTHHSLFADIPKQLTEELCQILLKTPTIRIERILSQGQASPEGFWYNQEQAEWVILLQGQARLSFANSESVELNPGDYLLIPQHCKHRVDWTTPNQVSIWLAVHIESEPFTETLFAAAGD
jgi:cupin 2 domain-containing protein